METPYDSMLTLALKKGRVRRGNREVVVDGTFRRVWSLVGPVDSFEGEICCFYHGSKILTVDMTRQRMSDHGYRGYSVSTTRNLGGWLRAVNELVCDDLPFSIYDYGYWVSDKVRIGDAHLRFVNKTGWVDGPWLRWHNYDTALAEQHRKSLVCLWRDQNWRYFTYDWDDKGAWVRRFLDAKSEKLWHDRERRRCRPS